MSAYPLTVISCDGGLLGPACLKEYKSVLTVMDARAYLKNTKHWVRCHYNGTQLDLCPVCSPRMANIKPVASRGGRPKKEK